MSNNLTLPIEMGIESLGLFLSDKTTTAIKKCVEGYSTRDSFSGKISSVAYRIFNAFKSIFGQSDWQRAKKAILNDVSNISPGLDKFKNSLIKPIVEPISEAALKYLVLINSSKINFKDINDLVENLPSNIDQASLQNNLMAMGMKFLPRIQEEVGP